MSWMRWLRRPAFAAAFAALGLMASSARAEFFEFSTTVSIDPLGSTPSQPPAFVTTGTTPITMGSFSYNAPTATFNSNSGNNVSLIALQSDPAPPHFDASVPAGATITFATIDASSGLAPGPSQTISFNYTFTLNVANYPTINSGSSSSDIGTITLSGRLTGTMGNGAVSLQNFDFASLPNGMMTTSGGEHYLVTLGGLTPSPLTGGTGGIGGLTVNLRLVPEPASIALFGVGGIAAFGVFRRRRKGGQPATARG